MSEWLYAARHRHHDISLHRREVVVPEESNALFEIEETIHGFRLVLPPRSLEEIRPFAWGGIGVGSVVLIFMYFWMGMPLREGIGMLQRGQAFGWALIAFAMFGLPGILFGVAALIAGVAVLSGKTYSIIERQDADLICTEKIGPLRWRRRTAVDGIRKLSCDSATSPRRGRSRSTQAPSELPGLGAIRDGDTFLICVGYPRSVLEAVAATLADRLDCVVARNGDLEAPIPAGESGTDDTPRQPADSKIVRHNVDNAIVYEIPPTGLWQGSKGLFFFSLLWNGLLVVFTIATVDPILNGRNDMWILIAVLGLFWVAGIGLLMAAINMGRRSTMIGVVAAELYVRTKSIFGEKDQRFARNHIERVEVGPSGMEMNDVPIMELQIVHSEGHVGLLSQRSDEELDWLAYELSELLNLSHPQQGETWKRIGPDGDLIEPSPGRILIRHFPDRAEITIPPLGPWTYVGMLIAGLVLFVMGSWMILLSVKGPGWIGNPFGQPIPFPNTVIGVLLLTMASAILWIWSLLVSRRFEISVSNDRLAVERYGFQSRKSFALDSVDVEFVDRRVSGVSVNNRPLDQLVVMSTNGDHLKLMTGWKTSEIDFVCYHVDRVLCKTNQR